MFAGLRPRRPGDWHRSALEWPHRIKIDRDGEDHLAVHHVGWQRSPQHDARSVGLLNRTIARTKAWLNLICRGIGRRIGGTVGTERAFARAARFDMAIAEQHIF